MSAISSFQVTHIGGTYSMRLFNRSKSEGDKLMNVHGFYRALSIDDAIQIKAFSDISSLRLSLISLLRVSLCVCLFCFCFECSLLRLYIFIYLHMYIFKYIHIYFYIC